MFAGSWGVFVGPVATLVAQAIIYPVDTVRRRLQVRGSPCDPAPLAQRTLGPWALGRHIAATEGWASLYAGLGVHAVKLLPAVGLQVLAFHVIRSMAVARPVPLPE